MEIPKKDKAVAYPPQKSDNAKPTDPQWTSGLKRLYDSVVDEPLPDSFTDLLSKLDENEGK